MQGEQGEAGPTGSSAAARTVLRISDAPERTVHCVNDENVADEECCPDGFDLVGVDLEVRDLAVCIEAEPSGRAVVHIRSLSDGASCSGLDDPETCCPDSFTLVGWADNDRTVCLED
jgi:hypothetical protein